VILVTVGTQLPFERLIMAMDSLSPKLDEPIFAQIGDSSYVPKNFEYCDMMQPAIFEAKFAQASRIVSHAGIGSVLTAKRHGKPIIIFPRRLSEGEHRNDHQLATCEQLETRPGIFVAYDEVALENLVLSDMPASLPEGQTSHLGNGRQRLIEGLADFIKPR
jgi:UDP-N-acetylglucosamine transferase subunit ALG13